MQSCSRTIRFVGLLLVSAGVACGGGGGGDGGPDITGMYQVTYHTYGDASCSTEGSAVTDPPYIRIVEGLIGYDYEECDSADPQSCQFSIIGFPEGRSDGWYLDGANTQTGGGTACNLYRTQRSAVLGGDGSLRIEMRNWAEFDERTEAECTLSAAQSLSDDADCQSYEVVVGTP